MIQNELKEKLTKIAEVLYKGRTAEGLSMMSEVLDPIQEIAFSMSEDQRAEFITEALSPALSAMQKSDGPLLADIISYEIMERIDA